MTADDFVRLVPSVSSLTGTPYLVDCRTGSTQPHGNASMRNQLNAASAKSEQNRQPADAVIFAYLTCRRFPGKLLEMRLTVNALRRASINWIRLSALSDNRLSLLGRSTAKFPD